jgi:hypothetical protein
VGQPNLGNESQDIRINQRVGPCVCRDQVVYSEKGSIDPMRLRRAIVNSMNERKPW